VSEAPAGDTASIPGPPPEPGPARFPWPPAEQDGLVAAFAQTWRGAALHPRPFFASLPPRDTGAAVLYYLIIGITAAALQLFWQVVLPPMDAGWLGIPDPAARLSPLVNFLLSPLYLLGSLLLAAGATHLLVLMLVPQQQGFATTVRVFAYAYSPALLAVIPRLGPLVGFVWMIVLAVVGLREAHRTSTGRAATAVLLPLVVAVVFVAVAAMLLAASAVLLSQ
jgi:hypothetical protein